MLNGTGEPIVFPELSLNVTVPVHTVGIAMGGVLVVTGAVMPNVEQRAQLPFGEIAEKFPCTAATT